MLTSISLLKPHRIGGWLSLDGRIWKCLVEFEKSRRNNKCVLLSFSLFLLVSVVVVVVVVVIEKVCHFHFDTIITRKRKKKK